MICKILGLFVNPLTADDKYSLLNRGNLFEHLQMQLSEKQKIFSEFFFAFSKFSFNFELFQQKGESDSWCIFEVKGLRKTRLDKCLKSPVWDDPPTSNMVNAPKRFWNLIERLCQIYWSLGRQISWKKSLVVKWNILGLFVNTLTADCKYFLPHRGNWLQHFQMQLSGKRKPFSPILFYIFVI